MCGTLSYGGVSSPSWRGRLTPVGRRNMVVSSPSHRSPSLPRLSLSPFLYQVKAFTSHLLFASRAHSSLNLIPIPLPSDFTPTSLVLFYSSSQSPPPSLSSLTDLSLLSLPLSCTLLGSLYPSLPPSLSSSFFPPSPSPLNSLSSSPPLTPSTLPSSPSLFIPH